MKTISTYRFILPVAFFSFLLLMQCSEEEAHGPAPVVLGVAPITAAEGDTIVISGDNFDNVNASVAFGGTAAHVHSRSTLELTVIVPTGAGTAEVSVKSNGHTVVFPHTFTFTAESPPTRHTLSIHENGRVASLLLTVAEFERFNSFGLRQDPHYELIRDVYRKFEDDFDFIFEIGNNASKPKAMPYGYESNVSNAIEGIGLEAFDYSGFYGSAGRLKSIVTLPTLYGLKNAPLLHEIAHCWANFAIKNTEYFDMSANKGVPVPTHWGFSGCGGMLGGFSQANIHPHADGTANKYVLGPGDGNTYSDFELYLMGLLPAEDLTPFDVFTDVVSWDGRVLVANTKTTWDRTRIESEFGPRRPDYSNSQKRFKGLVLVLTTVPLTEAQWAKLDAQASWFERAAHDDEPYINFWEATRGRAKMELGNLWQSVKK